jgi:hypothetical protein
MCRFGYKALERNRYAECVFCPHKIGEDCLEWNRENVVEMESEDAGTFQEMIPIGVRCRHFETCSNSGHIDNVPMPKGTKFIAGQVQVFTRMIHISTSRAYLHGELY